MNYEKIKKEIKEFVEERDWEQFHTPKNLSMALSVEASELLEIFQWQKAEEYKSATDEQKEMIRDEIADIFYYIVRISDKLDIDIEDALIKKMKKNRKKYPKELVKGKAVKYQHDYLTKLMITFKKTFDFYATDNELGNYISSMLEVVEGDIDPQIEFDVESDDQHRYVIVNILDKVLH